jgi:uncharacterized UBP type Zn finger protein
MKDVLLEGEDTLDILVDQNKEIKEGMKFFIEPQLENKSWPLESKKDAKSQYAEMKSVGCFNLGNTCYMNSVV